MKATPPPQQTNIPLDGKSDPSHKHRHVLPPASHAVVLQLVTGRWWGGTAFGGYKSRSEVPKLVEQSMSGDLPIDQYITHRFQGVEQINDAIDALHSGDCLRAVVSY